MSSWFLKVCFFQPRDRLPGNSSRRYQRYERLLASTLALYCHFPELSRPVSLFWTKERSDQPVFMSQIKDTFGKDTFDCREFSSLSSVLKSFQNWLQQGNLPTETAHWVVPTQKLDVGNFTATYYQPSEMGEHEDLTSRYPMVRVDELSIFIKRGAGIKLDQNGDIPIIGPGAIRPLELDASSLGKTTKDNLPQRPVIVEVGDVVLNNISTYLGAAAVVNEAVAGSYLSQHAVLVRPDLSRVLPEYLAAALNSDYVKPQIQQMATGTIIPASLELRASQGY